MLLQEEGRITEVHQGEHGCYVVVGIGEPEIIEGRNGRKPRSEYARTLEISSKIPPNQNLYGQRVRISIELL